MPFADVGVFVLGRNCACAPVPLDVEMYLACLGCGPFDLGGAGLSALKAAVSQMPASALAGCNSEPV